MTVFTGPKASTSRGGATERIAGEKEQRRGKSRPAPDRRLHVEIIRVTEHALCLPAHRVHTFPHLAHLRLRREWADAYALDGGVANRPPPRTA